MSSNNGGKPQRFTLMQKVAASQDSVYQALEDLETDSVDYYYLCTVSNGEHLVKSVAKATGYVTTWEVNHIAAVPDKRKVPYNMEAMPKCHTLIRYKEVASSGIPVITCVSPSGIHTRDNFYRFSEMTASIELSFDDGSTWSPFWMEL